MIDSILIHSRMDLYNAIDALETLGLKYRVSKYTEEVKNKKPCYGKKWYETILCNDKENKARTYWIIYVHSSNTPVFY